MKTFTAFATTAVVLLGMALVWNGIAGDSAPAPSIIPDSPTLPHAPDIDEPAEKPPQVAEAVDGDLSRELGQALEFGVALSHGAIGEANFDEIFAEVRVQAGETLPESRPPLNVALVVDRSGSMAGEPMEQARQAARTFVNALEPTDRVALISFDHQSRIDVESTAVDRAGRKLLNAAIDRMREGGATNISDGMRDGFEQVRRHREPNTVDRIVLMTDGIPNVGISDTEGLVQKTRSIRNEGITLSTLGFGTMYNSEMMASMAQEGAGNFRHIRTSQDLELAFSSEIEDLRSTVASGIQVELRPANGVRIAEVYGFSRETIRGGERITLGDLHASARRSVIVRLDVDEAGAGAAQQLLDVRTQFVDRILERPVDARFAMSVHRVRDQKQVDESINSQVMARVEEIRSQESLREVIDLYASGRAEAAAQRLEMEEQRSRQARRVYQIEDAEESGRVQRTLDRIGDGIRSHAPRSAAGRSMVFEEAEASSISIQGR